MVLYLLNVVVSTVVSGIPFAYTYRIPTIPVNNTYNIVLHYLWYFPGPLTLLSLSARVLQLDSPSFLTKYNFSLENWESNAKMAKFGEFRSCNAHPSKTVIPRALTFFANSA